MRAFFLFIFLSLTISSFGQGWVKQFDEGSQFGQSPIAIVAHPSGGVLAEVYNDSMPNVPFLYRIDQNGQLLWVKQPLDTTYWFNGKSLLFHDSAFYLFTGQGYSFNFHMVVTKLNLNGDTIWTSVDSFATQSVEYLDAAFKSNGNILIATNIDDWMGNSYVRMMEMDTTGSIIWDSTYTNLQHGFRHFERLRICADDGFFLHYVEPGNFGVYKFSPSRNIIDSIYSLSSLFPMFLNDFPLSDTGSLVLTADTTGFQFLRLTGNGDTLWNLRTDTMRTASYCNISELPNGEMIIGYCNYNISCGNIPSLMKVDNAGNIEWLRDYNTQNQGNVIDFVFTQNDGIYCTGANSPCYFTLNPVYRAQIIHFDSLGRVFSNSISGNIFYDNAGDCIYNSPDTYSHNWLVEANGNSGPFYAVTDSLGNYSMDVSTGPYTITQHINPTRTPVCPVSPNSYTVNFISTDSSIMGTDFANIFIPNQPDLSVNLIAYNIFRPGGDVWMRATFKNNGSTVLSGNITAVHDTFLISSNYSTAPVSVNTGNVVWTYSNLLPDEELVIDFHLNVPITAIAGQSVNVTASGLVANDINPLDNDFLWVDSIRTSYDPNDKRVFPQGWGSEGYIYENQELTYVVRFQNTGTDTAFNIVVSDQINSLLDLSTFQFISSSHYCTVDITPSGEVKFIFNNILLPDSNTNEMLSHGYVCFKITPNQTVLPGDVIVNGAAIYFDYNDPIFTNQTLNTIADPNSVQETATENNGSVKVFPNPASEFTTFNYEGYKNGQLNLQIWNVQGQLIEQHQLDNSGSFTLVTSQFEPGMYLWTIETGSDVIARDRLLIVR